ncbi:hypothetical protein SAMN02745227_01729 [Anaerobranca californiensis DSM 14826]|jgi:hypothetical protein|uniref:DinB family protein n=1 Tax=Anaerobranca californiensis DSM 14826 TaxID=1120989 RepID=A0A1M6QEZ2_9FIRM|nr:hypothetical protein [Anaerobranca californiensis]SHK18623.1 hypothetical protein SAMN02745227_01729 [Anaerobranca californiensis DSM 14826]
MEVIIRHLNNAFNLTFDLVDSIKTDDLKLKLKDLPSNTIGEQLWCIIGARESYLKAIINEEWMGFSCSLDDVTFKNKILQSLKDSAENIHYFLNNTQLTETQIEFLLNLLEHEIQHHGQLIRYFYGNKLAFPKSWNNRYTV